MVLMGRYVTKDGLPINVIRPTAIHCKGAAKKLSPDIPLAERLNGVMGVGLESDHTKYGPDRMIAYIEWMAANFQRMFFVIGSEELKYNLLVFGHPGQLEGDALCKVVRARTHEKRDELHDLIRRYGDIDRTSVMPSSRLDTSSWHGFLRRALAESKTFRSDVESSIVSNLGKRLEKLKENVGEVVYAKLFETLVDYSLHEIGVILEVLAHGVPVNGGRIPAHVKVGPLGEARYDTIAARICSGGDQCRYRYSETLRLLSMVINGRAELAWGDLSDIESQTERPQGLPNQSRLLAPVSQFSRVYFDYSERTKDPNESINGSGHNPPVDSEQSGVVAANRLESASCCLMPTGTHGVSV